MVDTAPCEANICVVRWRTDSRSHDKDDTKGERVSMPTKIAEGTTRYNVVFAHTTIVLFALWCVGHLISTKDVDFSLGGARGMLMFGLLLALCGSLLAHDFSTRDQEGSQASVASFHAVMGYIFVAAALVYALVQVWWRKKSFYASGTSVSLVFAILAITGYDLAVGSCGDRFVISHNHGQPVYSKNTPTFCVSHFSYEFQAILFLALGSYYNSMYLWRQKNSSEITESSLSRSDNDVEWTECIALLWFGICNLTFFIVFQSIVGYDENMQHDATLLYASAASGLVMVFFNGICVISWSCTLFGVECVGAKFRSLSSFLSLFSHGVAIIVMFYRDLDSSIYFFKMISKNVAIGKLQQTSISIFGFSVLFQAVAKLLQFLLQHCVVKYCADGSGSDKFKAIQTFSNLLVQANAIMTYGAGFAALFAQPVGAGYLVNGWKFDHVGISWFIIFLAVVMYAQDSMSSWLVDKVVQSGRNRRGNTRNNASPGGRYNKVEMVDINSSNSYADDEEPTAGNIENT